MTSDKKQRWIPVLIAAVIAAVIIITNRQGTPLPSYDASNDIPAATQPETQKPAPEGFPYTDNSIGLTMFIPADWQYILKDGFATFVHKASASWVQIRVEDYYPRACMGSEETYAQLAQEGNGSLVSFEWIGNSSYLAKYVTSTSSGHADHIEAVMFDRLHVVDISYVLDDTYYDRLADAVDYSLASISWERLDPIPSSLYLEYSSFGDFEFGIPYGWEGGYADGAYYAYEQSTGASYSVAISEGAASYENATQEDYIAFAGAGRESLELTSFINNGSVIIAQGSYIRSGEKVLFRQCLLAGNDYEYTMTQECPGTGYEAVAQVFDDLMNVFRVF